VRVPSTARQWRGGVGLGSLIRYRSGQTTNHRPRFDGVKLTGPDNVATWDIALQIAGGEYDYPGYVPRRGDRVVDIGANIGIFSLWAARRGATVTAYEPGVETFAHLAQNVADRRVTARHAAVVGEAELPTVNLFAHPDRSTRNTLLGREISSGVVLEHWVEVPAISIDDVLADGCDLLKADCEGAEFDIFAKVSGDRLRSVDRIIMEFHRLAGHPDVLLDRLSAEGFAARILKGIDENAEFGVIGAQRTGV
jgi:FkbM family methyltransferase